MTKRNSSQRVQDVIDRLSDLNVRELGELQVKLTYYRHTMLANVLRDILNFPPNGGDPTTTPEDSGAPGLEQGGEGDLPIIRAARQNGVIP